MDQNLNSFIQQSLLTKYQQQNRKNQQIENEQNEENEKQQVIKVVRIKKQNVQDFQFEDVVSHRRRKRRSNSNKSENGEGEESFSFSVKSKNEAIVFNVELYDEIVEELNRFNVQFFARQLVIEEIPQFIRHVLITEQKPGGLFSPMNFSDIYSAENNKDALDWNRIPSRILSHLLPYQRDGIAFGVKRHGRILLADEMGLGKTIQAIALACYYRHEWPLLVICPSTLRVNWKRELIKWDVAREEQVLVVDSSSKMCLIPQYKVSIVSYELLSRFNSGNSGGGGDDQHSSSSNTLNKRSNKTSGGGGGGKGSVGSDESSASVGGGAGANGMMMMMDFKPKVVIVDESHFVKSTMSKRTRATRPFIRNAKRAILLSGTATPSRPVELYDQIKPLFNSELMGGKVKFMTKATFGERYCNIQETPFGLDYSGASNIPELNLLLSRTIMIRRLKKHVLGELRPKNRRLIFISRTYDDAENQRIQDEASANSMMMTMSEAMELYNFEAGGGENSQIIQQFLITGKQKIPRVCDYLRMKVFAENKDKTEKFLLFAHHQCVLDGIESELIRFREEHDPNVEYIRIDGNTPNHVRTDLADYFCNHSNCKYAILSLTCAGTGLNFQTNCSNVIFCELFWTPGVLLQAEDRVHRIGTSTDTTVDVRYLVCDGTLDDHIWPMLQKKLDIVGTTLDRHTSDAVERRDHFKSDLEDVLLE